MTVRGGVADGVGEAVLDEVLCCFHAVADFDAGGFAAHGVCEELGDLVAAPLACYASALDKTAEETRMEG